MHTGSHAQRSKRTIDSKASRGRIVGQQRTPLQHHQCLVRAHHVARVPDRDARLLTQLIADAPIAALEALCGVLSKRACVAALAAQQPT